MEVVHGQVPKPCTTQDRRIKRARDRVALGFLPSADPGASAC